MTIEEFQDALGDLLAKVRHLDSAEGADELRMQAESLEEEADREA